MFVQTATTRYKRKTWGVERTFGGDHDMRADSRGELERRRKELEAAFANTVRVYKAYDARIEFGAVREV